MNSRESRTPDRSPPGSPLVRVLSPLRDFLQRESAGGFLVAATAAAALLWANSPWSGSYESFWSTRLDISVAGETFGLDLRHWVNDGLMTLFFLVVGLEIKRELTDGHLSQRRSALLPVAAAVGGMAVPALVYLAVAGSTDPNGWGVPVATDIALAMAVVSVSGDRVPPSMRAFLLGVAIVDDVGAIAVIAVAYSSGLSWAWLAVAAAAVLAVVGARRSAIHIGVVYLGLGVVCWFALHEAGIHPTLAGVVMGLLAPTTPRLTPEFIDVEQLNDLSTVADAKLTSELARASASTVEWLQYVLHPWTSYLIVPTFALANAGIELSLDRLNAALRSPVAWGVFVGLVVGKPIGLLVAAHTASRLRVAALPDDATRQQLAGVGGAAGIGFTVSIFIAELAFDDPVRQDTVKLAILAAAIVSAAGAIGILRARQPGRDERAARVWHVSSDL